MNIAAYKPRFFGRVKDEPRVLPKTDPVTAAEIKEDMRILKTLDKIKRDIDLTHKHFDEATDETLIDVYIYEMKALNMKFKYYHEICKERGLVR